MASIYVVRVWPLPQTTGSIRVKMTLNRVVKRVRYVCYGKTRKQTKCDGQTGYTAHIFDGIIDKLVRQIFERMKAIPKSEVVNIRYKEKMEERKSFLQSVRGEYAKAAADLETLKGEVLKTIRGESTFSKELLGALIAGPRPSVPTCKRAWRAHRPPMTRERLCWQPSTHNTMILSLGLKCTTRQVWKPRK